MSNPKPTDLIFGESIFKRGRKGTNPFFRSNIFTTLYGLAMVIVVGWSTVNYNKTNPDPTMTAIHFVIAFGFCVTFFKVIVGPIRYIKTKIPIWGDKAITKTDMRYKTGQKAVGSMIAITGYEDMTPDEIVLHKNQQLYRFVYNAILALIFFALLKLWV